MCGSTTIGTREPGFTIMTEELHIEDLEEAQQKLEQTLHEEILKREVSNSKIQAHFDVVNERLNELLNIADSIRLQLLKMNKNKMNINLGGKYLQGELKEEIKELSNVLVDLKENVDDNRKDYDGHVEPDFIEVEKTEVEDESVKDTNVTDVEHKSIEFELNKLVPSSNLQNEIILNSGVKEILLQLPSWRAPTKMGGIGDSFLGNYLKSDTNWWEAPKRKDGIGISLLGNDLKCETNSGCDLNSRTGYGETALMICARHKHEECLKLLASAGSDFGSCNVSDHSATSIYGLSKWNLGFHNVAIEVIPAENIARLSNFEVFSSLLFVTRANDVEALTKLIKHQDLHNIDKMDDFGFSTVMVAASGGHVEMFRLLMNAGADLEMQNKYDKRSCKISLHPLQSYVSDSLNCARKFRLFVKDKSKVEVGKNVGFNCSEFSKSLWKMEKYANLIASFYIELEFMKELEAAIKEFQQHQHEESRNAFGQNLTWQKQNVRYWKDVSIWNQTYGMVIELLASTLCTIFAHLCVIFGNACLRYALFSWLQVGFLQDLHARGLDSVQKSGSHKVSAEKMYVEVFQVLMQWMQSSSKLATWEDIKHFRRKFSTFDPWGQGSFSGGGIVMGYEEEGKGFGLLNWAFELGY